MPPDLVVPPTDNTLTVPDAAAGDTPGADANGAGEPKASSSTTASGVLPTFSNVQLKRDGNVRWLLVQAQPDQVFPKIRDFLIKNGLTIANENPRAGLIETNWAENRARPSDAMQKYVGKVLPFLFSSGTQDKFRVRLERGEMPGTTEVYLAHQGLELAGGDNAVTSTGAQWQPRAADPELEADMLQLLMVDLGVEKKRAQDAVAVAQKPPQPNVELRRHPPGETVLLVNDDLDGTWRRVGSALDRLGVMIDDRNRSQGIYYITYNDPGRNDQSGFFSHMFGGDTKKALNQFQIQISAADKGTQVQVLNRSDTTDQGVKSKDASSAPAPASIDADVRTHERILTVLYEQLK